MPHRFTESMIHTNDQPGPPSPYVSERRHTAKVSSGTSNFAVGNAQEYCTTDLGERNGNSIGVNGLTDAKWMGDKRGDESTCMKLKIDKRERNQRNSIGDSGRRAGSVCHL